MKIWKNTGIKGKMLSAALTLFALCACLAACGADQKGQADQKEEMKTEEKAGEKEEPKTQTKAEDDVWRGIAPGMEDLSDITERTEYMDVAVESEVLFDNDLKEMVPVNEMQGRPRTEDGTTWLPVGTRFVQGAVLGGGRRKGRYLAVRKGQQQGASGERLFPGICRFHAPLSVVYGPGRELLLLRRGLYGG